MTNHLHAHDEDSWLATIWNALHAYREDLIPEGADPSYDEEWSNICTAMAWTREAIGLPDEIDEVQSTPLPASPPDDDRLHTAMCIWEYMLDHDQSGTAISRLRNEIGTVELRHLAIRLIPFCCDVYTQIPEFLTLDKCYDWDVIPAILDTIDFAVRPVMPPPVPTALELAKKALAPTQDR